MYFLAACVALPLERLMNREPYKSHDRRVVTLLTRNYRSHEALLTLPSKLFYEDSLLAEANRSMTESLVT